MTVSELFLTSAKTLPQSQPPPSEFLNSLGMRSQKAPRVFTSTDLANPLGYFSDMCDSLPQPQSRFKLHVLHCSSRERSGFCMCCSAGWSTSPQERHVQSPHLLQSAQKSPSEKPVLAVQATFQSSHFLLSPDLSYPSSHFISHSR